MLISNQVYQFAFYCCPKDDNPQRLREEKGFSQLVVYNSLYWKSRAGLHDRTLTAETESQIMEKCCFLVFSSWLTCLAFLYILGPPVQESHHPQQSGNLPDQLLIKETPNRRVGGPIWWEHIFKWCFFFPEDYRLYRIGKTIKKN